MMHQILFKVSTMRYLFITTLFFAFFLQGCGGGSERADKEVAHYIPPQNSIWQYQLTGELNTTTNATVYDIDMEESSKEKIADLHRQGFKVICYFSAGSAENWRSDFDKFQAKELGNDLDGWVGEQWLDIRSHNVKEIMLSRLDRAKAKGCDAVEADNVDGYSNDSGFSLQADDQLEYNKYLAQEAHKRGLGIGLKNDLSQVNALVNYFDFAINEQCFVFKECSKLSPFIQQKKAVFTVEYKKKYLDKQEMVKLCNASQQEHFNTNILPRNLDGSWRYNCSDYLFHTHARGFGSSDAFKFHKDQWLNVTALLDGNYSAYKDKISDFNETKFQQLSTFVSKSRFVVLWLTQGWKESWFNKNSIAKIIQEGRIPVFVYWYFGDHLREDGYLSTHQGDYFTDVNRTANFLKHFRGTKLLILEPEFNKANIITKDAELFTKTISQAIAVFKKEDNQTLISLAMMDTGSRTTRSNLGKCGFVNCALGDKEEWAKPEVIYNKLIDKLDFISFQQMVGQFSRDPQNPGTWNDPNPIAYDDAEIGIDFLAQRMENMALFLKQKYHKPVFLPYIAVATATWNDKDNNNKLDSNEINATGWEQKAKNFYRDFNGSNLFGYAVMELFDNPTHDNGGYGFFLDDEYHLGIISSQIQDKQLTGAINFKSNIVEEVFQ